MRVAVAVVPGLLVAVLTRRREQSVQDSWQVAAQARLELDGADRRRAADIEDVDDAGADARLDNGLCHLVGQVVHVAVAGSRHGKLLLVDHRSSPHVSPASDTIKGTPWRGVLAFQRAEVSMFKKILLPLDLTDRHAAALRLAADLARQVGGEI